MYLFNLVLCCLIIYNTSAVRIIKGIIGRKVSFSWTLNNTMEDALLIMHNESVFHRIFPFGNHSVQHQPLDLERISVSYLTSKTVRVTVNLMSITEDNSGMYRVIQQYDLTELVESVHLQTIDKSQIPKIKIIRHNISDLSLILECNMSRTSTGNFSWMLNGSLIQNRSRYSPIDEFLSIRNLKTDDENNLLKCRESESELESDPYNIKISGPKFIKFAPNVRMVKEHSSVNVTCIADCYPICSWTWTKLNLSSSLEDIISEENTLYIKDITRYDAGTYSCKVLNQVTNISLQNVTSLDVVYGPDVIVFNSSEKIIQLDDTDSITISCSADCNPPCQIGWTKTDVESLLRAAELSIDNVKKDYNYTCHATNAAKDNTPISDTIYVIKKSGNIDFTTTATTLEEDARELNHYTTTVVTQEEDTEDFLSKSHLQYILYGMGIILAAAFLACLMRKAGIRLRAGRVSKKDTFAGCNRDNGDVHQQDVNLAENYWTIISHANGELSTVIESDFERHREPSLIGQNFTPIQYEAEQSMRTDDANINEELVGYLTPIHSGHAELDAYIHPIHKQNESEQSVMPDNANVNAELEEYPIPINLRHDEPHYPVHTDYLLARQSI